MPRGSGSHWGDGPDRYLAGQWGAVFGGEWFHLSETGRRNQAENNSPTTCPRIQLDADKTAVESPWNSMAALKKRVGRLSYSVIRLYPVAEKIAGFCACFR